MSGTKTTYLIVCMFFCTSLFAVAWNCASIFCSVRENDPLSYVLSPIAYPDTFCVATSWSPIYHGFDIHEGHLYVGWHNMDISLRSQMHRLMSNHELSVGVKILEQEQIKAGLQVHYACSFLYSINTCHEGSVSAAVSVFPRENWTLTFYTLRFLSLPSDSSGSLFESQSAALVSMKICPHLLGSLGLVKRDALPWDMILNLEYSPIAQLGFSLAYKIQCEELTGGVYCRIGSWQMQIRVSRHEYLGLNEHFILAFSY